jgi:hypothetical protein|tara:strand:+ start:384 stop:626 length:243 start_codon:yes stop_codon:yes gene_type:complete
MLLSYEIEGPFPKNNDDDNCSDFWGKIVYDEKSDFEAALDTISKMGYHRVHIRGNWSGNFTTYRLGGRWVVEFDAILIND